MKMLMSKEEWLGKVANQQMRDGLIIIIEFYLVSIQFKMQLVDGNLMNSQIRGIIENKVEMECFLCMGEFDQHDYAPVIMCLNQHTCCAPCMHQLLKNQPNKLLACPHCHLPINRKVVTKNRLLLTLYQIITAYKQYVSQLKLQIEAKKNTKSSLLSKNPRLVSSFIETQYTTREMLSKESIEFDDVPTAKSMAWMGLQSQKRRQAVLAYALREKMGQLQQIARSESAFQQITKIRSGYGTIKRIQCMEYFTNLRELLLYNNHILAIEGLSSNIKLNVLSLAYNKVEKVQNIGQLKQLKRLSLECNKIGKGSAEFLTLYEWKQLESLTISFHESTKQQNQECLLILFSGKSVVQWASLKTVYIYNSKAFDAKDKSVIAELIGKRKPTIQICWS